MVTQVRNVISSLETDSEDDVRIIGIWGMGGAGKTTLARAVFDHISIRFEGKSFVENNHWKSGRFPNRLTFQTAAEDQKEIFLDVACILKGKAKYKAIRILEGCGFHAQIGLEVLEQRSLIYISYNGDVGMHDHIEEMGKNIVRRLHPNEPNKHRRLCDKEEIEEILVNDLGTKATRIMNLKNPSIHPATIIKNLQTLKALELLSVYDADRVSQKWVFNEDVKYFPDTLRSLHWTGYHASSLPKTFQANNLVNLEMPRSYISQLWEGGEKKVE
ncbi:hypothetical protein E3N88_09464 [Mikania micrantha]|uniref:Uncharacterized protein n=1 Tax=Mikania micrantha TaxID=192012 RepID=A0A5N6PK11_9ASTR|nr:hypothetical protein E3N88_09464 [Mikania micrantha]